MSTRRAMAHAFGFIAGLLIMPAGLTGFLLIGTASPALAATNPCAAQLTALAVSTTSPTPTATPSSSAPASATPTPTVSASASASATPSPTPTTTSPSPSPTTTSPSPSPTTTSPSPSPTGSSTSPAASDQLCLTVQPLAASVTAGGQARYAIWVWLAGKVNGSAKVKIAAKPANLAPRFTVCATTGGASCSVGLTAAQAIQLRAAVTVPQNAAGTNITLTATGTSSQSTASASASGSVTITAAAAGTTIDPPGVGVTLPGGLPPGALSAAGLPMLPSAVNDPSLAFPQVSPTPDPSPAPAPIHVSDVSASFPLSTRLVGSQIVGLAVLAAAVTIAVARLSLRRRQPQDGQDPS